MKCSYTTWPRALGRRRGLGVGVGVGARGYSQPVRAQDGPPLPGLAFVVAFAVGCGRGAYVHDRG